MDLSKHLTIEHEWLNYDHGGVQQFFGDAMQRILQIAMFFFRKSCSKVDPESLVMWMDCLKPESVMLYPLVNCHIAIENGYL